MTVINIKYVNPAKDEKKYGSIVGTDQTRYMVPAGMVHQFQTGSTVDVPTKTEKWGESIVTIVAGHANGSPSHPKSPKPPPSGQRGSAHRDRDGQGRPDLRHRPRGPLHGKRQVCVRGHVGFDPRSP